MKKLINYERELSKVLACSFIKYEGCTIRRNGGIYYWGKNYGTLEEMKAKIDEALVALGHNINQPKK